MRAVGTGVCIYVIHIWISAALLSCDSSTSAFCCPCVVVLGV